jgi:DnaJ-class molecular chaperone
MRALEAEQVERTAPREVPCPGCNGAGRFLDRPCWRCAGIGRVPFCATCGGRGQVLRDSGPFGSRMTYVICPDCSYARVTP